MHGAHAEGAFGLTTGAPTARHHEAADAAPVLGGQDEERTGARLLVACQGDHPSNEQVTKNHLSVPTSRKCVFLLMAAIGGSASRMPFRKIQRKDQRMSPRSG